MRRAARRDLAPPIGGRAIHDGRRGTSSGRSGAAQADVKRLSWAWFNQSVCALRFFYLHVLDHPDLVHRIPYGRRERHLPVVLSVDELVALLGHIDSLRDRVLLTVLYSAGLRLGEVCRLRVADIDSGRMLMAVRQG